MFPQTMRSIQDNLALQGKDCSRPGTGFQEERQYVSLVSFSLFSVVFDFDTTIRSLAAIVV